MKMKLFNIKDIDTFFNIINQCEGNVMLVSHEGDRINLRSKLSQYVSIVKMFSNGFINELDIETTNEEDSKRLMNFMYQGE